MNTKSAFSAANLASMFLSAAEKCGHTPASINQLRERPDILKDLLQVLEGRKAIVDVDLIVRTSPLTFLSESSTPAVEKLVVDWKHIERRFLGEESEDRIRKEVGPESRYLDCDEEDIPALVFAEHELMYPRTLEGIVDLCGGAAQLPPILTNGSLNMFLQLPHRRTRYLIPFCEKGPESSYAGISVLRRYQHGWRRTDCPLRRGGRLYPTGSIIVLHK